MNRDYVSAGEFMQCAEQFLEQKMHPTVIIAAFRKALDDMQDILENLRCVASFCR